MNSYEALAGAYDVLTEDVQYRRRADYLVRQFQKSRIPVHNVLDLACGTGSIACLLAERGYAVTAIDGSVEMLTEAAQKAATLSLEKPPFLLHQDMPKLRLMGPVDAVVSTLDSLNYLTRPSDIQETFRRVAKYLVPGGRFIFDVNTPYKLQRMDGQVWLDEIENVYCVWRTEFSQRTKVCTYWVDLFRHRRDGSWSRGSEKHRERAWEESELRQWLTEAGFGRITVTGDMTDAPPGPEEDRWIFFCEKSLTEEQKP